jgi:hypothetical protein
MINFHSKTVKKEGIRYFVSYAPEENNFKSIKKMITVIVEICSG